MAVTIQEIKVRAAIRMGGENGFYLETPYVQSFNVKRARGEMSSSFSASLKVKHSQLNANKTNMVGNLFEIWAGTISVDQAATQENLLPDIFSVDGSRYIMSLASDSNSNMDKIFTGYALSLNFNPCRDDAEFIFLNVSGQDIFYFLQNKKFTRRVNTSSLEMWGAITGVTRTRANFDTKFPEKLNENTPVLNNETVMTNFRPKIVTTPSVKESSKGDGNEGFMVSKKT